MKTTEKETTSAKNMINWSELSRLIIKGDRNGIRTNKIPKKHQEKVSKLLSVVQTWINENT